MRFAYADPPYPGQAKRLYGDHPDYQGEVDHGDLVARLMDEYPDGWALSTSAGALQHVLSLCPEPSWSKKNVGRRLDGTGVRVLAWCRPHTPWRPVGIQWGWEPVVLYRGRKGKQNGFVRDFLHNADQADIGFPGAKPYSFCAWIFECLGAQQDDELHDLYPGSGAVSLAWERWRRTPSLLTSLPAPVPATPPEGAERSATP